MPRACAICGRRSGFGSNVSHSKVHTGRRFEVNLQRALVDGDKVLICTGCRRTRSKPARMAQKKARAARR